MTTHDYVGIVGAEEAKFTTAGQVEARALIARLLEPDGAVLVSGGCHLGGVDIWAEEEYDALLALESRPESVIHPPAVHAWAQGYKPRNLLIARDSTVVHNITVARYPAGYAGMRFAVCYHCERRFRKTDRRSPPHVKSGGCWTAYEAEKMGKRAHWHVISNKEET
ncbi:MAG: hypothetical protein ACRD3C_20875 [Vicinamibacterales bacterium]